MFSSRSILLRSVISGLKNKATNATPKCVNGKQLMQVRNHGDWTYRTGPKMPEKKVIYMADLVGAFMWWWVLWHIFTEPEHILGEFPYPDASKWTDQELGIPPDDVE